MSEAAIRTAVFNAVNGVTDVGQVHDYQRWAAEWGDFLDLFKTTIGGTEQIRGWNIVHRGFEAIRDAQFERFTLREHTFWAEGFMGLDDSEATEKTFTALAEAVCDALDADTTIHSSTYRDASPASLERNEARMFGGALCHYARVVLTVTEESS